MTPNWRMGLPLALTTSLLWGILPVALTPVLEHMDPLTVTWYRFVTAALLLMVILAATRGLPRLQSFTWHTARLLALAVVGLASNYVMFVVGLRHTSPTVAQVVSQFGPVFLMAAGVLIFHEHLRGLQRWGIGALIAGQVLFFNERMVELLHPTHPFGFGVMLLIAGSAIWTLYGMSQKLLHSQLGSQHILLAVYVGASLLLLPLAVPSQIRALTGSQLGLLMFCGINTLIAYGSFAESLKHWEVSRVGAVLATTPLFTLASMWIAGHLMPGVLAAEQLNALSVTGALLVVAGSALCALGGSARPTPLAAQAVAEP